MLESEDGVLLFVFAAVNRESLSRLPAPDSAFASIEISGDLLPRFQSSLWSIPLWHLRTPEDYTRSYAATLRSAACQ